MRKMSMGFPWKLPLRHLLPSLSHPPTPPPPRWLFVESGSALLNNSNCQQEQAVDYSPKEEEGEQ